MATGGSIGPTDNAHRAADADQRAAKTVGERATTVAYGEIDTRLSENPLAPLEYGTAPFDTVIAASQRDDMSVAVEPEVFEYEADEPASDSYSASYADDLDASFGIVPHASTAQAATGDTGHSVNRSADDSAKHDVDENVDDEATADDSDVELTVRSGVPRPQVVPWAAQPLGADALGEFESEGTGVLQRENGFVAPRSRRGSDAPQVHMSLRTPTSLDQVDLDDVDEASGGVPDACSADTEPTDFAVIWLGARADAGAR